MPLPDTRSREPAGRLEKLLALDPLDAARLAEAVFAVLAARVALRLIRVEPLVRFSRRIATAALSEGAPGKSDSESEASGRPETLCWAVGAASNALGARCLPRSLALAWLLARRGWAADLCLGAPRGGHPVPWHAWIELDGRSLGEPTTEPDGSGETPFELVCRLPR
jgi:hypothetical protein